MTGDRDPTRPEYVVSDMLRPLPELDFNFVPFDSAHEAVSAINPVVSPVTDCQSDDLPRLSYAAVLRAEEGDAASRVISADDAFSSGSENSPGGFRKRHNMSPFRLRVDKKLLQNRKDCGRGAQHGSCSDTAIGQPVVSDRGCGTRYGQSDTVVGQLIFVGRGRGFRGGMFSDGGVSRPAFGRGRASSARAPPPVQSVLQPELQSCANSAALHDTLSADTGRRHERQRMRSHLFHNSGNKPARIEMMSSAASEDAFLPAEQQFMPMYSAPFEESDAGQATSIQMPVDIDVPGSASSAPSVGAAAVDGDLLSQRHHSKAVRQAPLLFSLFEQPDHDDDDDDDGADGAANRHIDGDVELIKFEPPARSVALHSISSFIIANCFCLLMFIYVNKLLLFVFVVSVRMQ